MALIVPLDPTAPTVTYGTIADARAVGATGTDDQVAAALAAASSRVDRVTRWWWAPRAGRVTGQAGPDGRMVLPRPVITVDSVTIGGSVQAASTYTVQATSLGGRLVLNLRAAGEWDGLATVVPRYSSSPRGQHVEVVGTFGEAAPPLEVVRAAALIAAALTPGGAAGAVNVEGDTDLPPRAGTVGTGGTGVAEADDLLRPYLRNRVKVA